MADEPLSFSERRKQLLESRGKLAPKPTPEVESDLVPDVLPERTEEDLEIDRIIDNVDILDAYRRWCGKKVDERTANRREGLKVSCPKPEHPDNNPSAWLNLDKNTWFCGGCQEGGDVYDIAAFKFNIPDYKSGKNFHELRKLMAEDLGYQIKKVAGGTVIYQTDEDSTQGAEPDKSDIVDKADSEHAAPQSESSNVSEMWAEEESAESTAYPEIKWRELATEDTFLYEYCLATSHDDAPEEYHFWHGLLALAHAVGRNVYLDDTRPVYANLLLCLLGGTGYGKTRSRDWLDQVLHRVAPYKDNGLDTTGVMVVTPPASGEHLIKSFQHQAYDASLPKNSGVFTSVNGIVDFDEFASLLARANRQGNTLKTTIMAMADCRNQVKTGSLTHGNFLAERPFCSITATTQPKALRALLSKTDAGSGFLNRWVFIGGQRKQREVIGGSHSTMRVDLDASCDALKAVRAWGAKERAVTMTEEGLAELERFYNERIFPLQDKDDSDLLKRLDLLFKRLILLFCINERIEVADARVVKLAESLLDYVVRCYGILNSEIGITALSEISAEILRHVERHQEKTGRGASSRDLQKYMKRKNYSPDLIKRALETMVALDWLELEKPKAGVGRPAVRYKVVS